MSNKKSMLKNPPKELKIGSWVERTSIYGNKSVTHGFKYKVRGCFSYLNQYGSKGDRYCLWDQFITIKNDYGWTVKMNVSGFKPCDPPISDIDKLKNRISELESIVKNLNKK